MDQSSKGEYIFEHYKVTQENFREGVNLAWEILKFYILLISSLLTLAVTIIGIIITSEYFNLLEPNSQRILIGISSIFPIIIISFSRYGKFNFTRECERFYRYLSIIIKIEEREGIRDMMRDNKNIFPQDEYIVPDDFRNIINKKNEVIKSSTDFVEYMVSGKARNFYSDSVTIFNSFNFIAGLIIIGIIVGIHLI